LEQRNMPNLIFAGIDIGGTKTAVVLSAEPPRIQVRFAFPTLPEKGPQAAIDLIVKNLNQALSSQALSCGDLTAIGVSCGSPLDSVHGIIQSPPNLPTWKDVAICQILEAAFGAPCYLENDANAGALAEARFGSGQGAKDFVFLTMGTGIGAGLILNGQLHHGNSDAAGEIGHVRLTRYGPRGHGKTGSVEGWASGGGMAKVAEMYVKAALARGENTLLMRPKESDLSQVTAKEVAEAAQAGDAVAKAVVRRVGERLGEAISILIDVINPECIAVGGLALRFGEALLGPAREIAQREALQGSMERCRIIPATLGEQIGDIAALCVAMNGLARAKSLSAAPAVPRDKF
jgi:glucokinase